MHATHAREAPTHAAPACEPPRQMPTVFFTVFYGPPPCHLYNTVLYRIIPYLSIVSHRTKHPCELLVFSGCLQGHLAPAGRIQYQHAVHH
jgi:hypothetical protein